MKTSITLKTYGKRLVKLQGKVLEHRQYVIDVLGERL